jgi:Na+/phosphate symporter
MEDEQERRRPGRWGRDVVWNVRNGHGGDMAKWITTVLTIVGMAVAGTVFVNANAERIKAVETKQEVAEKQRDEDRKVYREAQEKLEKKVDNIDKGINQILIKLGAEELRERERERERARLEREGRSR